MVLSRFHMVSGRASVGCAQRRKAARRGWGHGKRMRKTEEWRVEE